MMTKRGKGNPHWGRTDQPLKPVVPTLFETCLKEWGLSLDQAKTSRQVREFIHKHQGNRYIPEDILKSHGFSVDVV